MKKRLSLLAACLVAAAFAAGCADVQARWAFRTGNKKYEGESYRAAIEDYELALQHKPDMVTARFYLASSHQALYKPDSEVADNSQHLDIAVEQYELSLEQNRGTTGNEIKVRDAAIAALTGIYSDDPYRDFDAAYGYAMILIEDHPEDTKNLYALANLYEKFERVEEAEEQYRKIVDLQPDDLQACGALAAFYNKPLWEGASKFDEAIGVLHRCAELAPDEPEGYQKVATFYWDKAYRDPELTNREKDAYADKGLEAVDKALALKSDYFEAFIFKGLLYRVKAGVTSSPRLRQQYLEEAKLLQDRGLEIKEALEAEQEAAAALAAAAGNEEEG